MHVSPRLAPSIARRLLMVGAAVAVVAQLALVVAPLAEAWQGQDAAAHVEASGTATHYAHNDATCAACQARTLMGLAIAPATPTFAATVADARIVTAADGQVVAQRFSPNNPRAPPASLRI